MILFEHPLSPYAQKNKIALREKNVPFELKLPMGIGAGAGMASDFTSASPRGEVPALVDGDTRIFDSTIILEYIEEKWPTPPLLPRDPALRARARMIEDAMDTHYEAINWGLGEIRFMGRAKGELAAKIEARAAQQVAAWQRWLEKQLGNADWFGGASFGWADLSVIPYINGSAGFGLTPVAGSKLAAWAARANARPSVAQTAAEATASIAGMSGVSDLIEKGLFKREYRDHRLEWMIKSGGLQVVLDGLAKDNIRFSPEFE
ncbi:MAG: glutathione S-transferase family protein [Deltaproteobacteria bacterium]|nr:glutathione S-transferase family protein [Deltaproteobacteria bacterium]